jgi:hypothetical protein
VRLVVEQSGCGDALIAGGESFSEITYYLRRLSAPGCLQVIGFPREIEQHPGWIDADRLLAHPQLLEQEAEQLAAELSRLPPGHKIWFFYSKDDAYRHREVTDVLMARLDRSLHRIELLDLSGSFFDGVSLYQSAAAQE